MHFIAWPLVKLSGDKKLIDQDLFHCTFSGRDYHVLMDIRLITVKEDFERAYRILNQKEYPLSFYEYTLKHENYQNSNDSLKLIGIFQEDICLGTISYKITPCPQVGKILEVKEIYQSSIKGHKALIDFLDKLACDEDCLAIKICKNHAERLNQNIFDRLENFFKRIAH